MGDDIVGLPSLSSGARGRGSFGMQECRNAGMQECPRNHQDAARVSRSAQRASAELRRDAGMG